MEPTETDTRGEQRTNMFVLATLSSASASGSVKIRNMSSSGALIEGAALPAVGEQAQIVRGTSSVLGTVVWSSAGKAGIRFDGSVEVRDWTPGGSVAQQRVDRVIQQVKAGAIPLGADERPISQGLAPSDLAKLARALDTLADTLADDPVTVARFGAKLQTLDIASQVLRRLSQRPS